MSEPRERVPSETATSPENESTGSPLRSVFAVISGFVVLWILGMLYATVVYSVASAHFPDEQPPTTVGLALTLAGALPNGIVAGLMVGRIAGFAPIVHAAVLGGVIGFFAMMSSDQARGMPWWFALGRVVLPTLFVVLGGAIAKAMARSKRA